jgi:hypothetical protein
LASSPLTSIENDSGTTYALFQLSCKWREGIEANLQRKELEDAWSYIAAKSPEEFMDLRTFVPPRLLDDNNPCKHMR